MNLKEEAYEMLKDRILNGVYLPGQMLNEKSIIEELGISRTPFREAINALSKENLVDIYPRRGMFVTEITLKDVSDLYGMRKILEPFAVRLAFPNIPPTVLTELKGKLENFSEKSYDQIVREDEDLHSMILRYADNTYLSRMMEQLYEHNKRVRVFSTRSEEDVRITISQHQVILDALIAGDVERAVKEMEQHIDTSRERAFHHIFANKSFIVR